MNFKRKIIVATLLTLGGMSLFLVVDDTFKGVMLVVGSVLMNIGINEATLIYEKWKGDID